MNRKMNLNEKTSLNIIVLKKQQYDFLCRFMCRFVRVLIKLNNYFFISSFALIIGLFYLIRLFQYEIITNLTLLMQSIWLKITKFHHCCLRLAERRNSRFLLKLVKILKLSQNLSKYAKICNYF